MKVLLLASGGDASGMNKFIAKTYRAFGKDAYAVIGGFSGLIEGNIRPLREIRPKDHANKAGCCIFSSRCPEFATVNGFKKGLKNVQGFDAVIVLGGNGSYQGARQLAENGVRTVFVPATIDNDVTISEYSIGFHTAVKACCDYYYNTMPSMQAFVRTCVFTVMGRHHDTIAKACASAVQADVCITDDKIDYAKIAKICKDNKAQSKATGIILRENIISNEEFIKNLQNKARNIEIKSCVVGHLQRGTKPTKVELKIASRLAKECAKEIKRQEKSFACVWKEGGVKIINYGEKL